MRKRTWTLSLLAIVAVSLMAGFMHGCGAVGGPSLNSATIKGAVQ